MLERHEILGKSRFHLGNSNSYLFQGQYNKQKKNQTEQSIARKCEGTTPRLLALSSLYVTSIVTSSANIPRTPDRNGMKIAPE